MWLSQAIEKGEQTKESLRELDRLARKSKDATKLPVNGKFFSTEIRWLRPNVYWYIAFVLVFGIVGGIRAVILEVSEGKDWLEVFLKVIVPIFVLAVTITNLARSFSESVKFAGEYFNEVCKMEIYSCLTLFTIIMTVASKVIAESGGIPNVIIGILAGFCLGGTLSCVTGIAFIIRETIRCSETSAAVQAATNYAARKLSHALDKEYYLTLWMTKYEQAIEEWCKRNFKKIRPPSRYFGILGNGNSNHKEVTLNFRIDIHEGALDYKFEELKKIDALLNKNDAELIMYPHSFQKDNAILGVIRNHQVESIDESIGKVNRIAKKGCRFHKDRFREASERFWKEHFNKMDQALEKAISENEISQMYLYLDSLVRVIETVEEARKDEEVRKTNDRLDKCWELIDLYRKSLRQILMGGKQLVHQEQARQFTNLLITSLQKQVEQMLKSGDWATLKLITSLIPRMYAEYKICEVNEDDMLWGSRARFGSFYDFAGSLLSKYESNTTKEDREQIKLVLHKGIISWLLIAKDNNDDELITSLCEAARKLVFPDKKVTFEPQALIKQHFILCGKMLEFLMDKDPNITAESFKLLCFEKHDNTLRNNIDYEQLVQFFTEGREFNLRDILREFSETDWDKNPLSGGGFGIPSFTFSGDLEFDYMFIYLALLSIWLLPDIKPINFDFSHWYLKNKIDKFKDIARNVEIYNYKHLKEKFNKWLDACEELYERKEAERIAGAIIDKETVKNYDKGFQEGLKESIPLVDYCIKKGHIQISDTASIKQKWHIPKEYFMGESGDVIVRKGKSSGKDFGNDKNTWTVRSLIDYKDEENDIEDVDTTLIRDNTAREKAKKEVQRAVDWLKNTGCNIEEGIIVLRGVGADVLHLFEDDRYQPAWREEGMERGFEGYYHGYPVLNLWGAKKRPFCAAMDLRGWDGLIMRPELASGKKAGEVLKIRDLTEEEIKKATKDKPEEKLRVQGYCAVELEIFWEVPEEKPKQKIFLYEIPAPKSAIKDAVEGNCNREKEKEQDVNKVDNS